MPLSDFPVRAQVGVSDIRRASEFYEEKLGLPVLSAGPSAAIPDGARTFGSGGGSALIVYQTAAAGSETTVATWFVDDIEQVVAELAANGVEVVRYVELDHDADGITARAGGGRIAWFEDPDRNIFAVESDA